MTTQYQPKFLVDENGLAELLHGKSKGFLIRELVANAWDENITTCTVETAWKNGLATISVEDDNPQGFKDLTDAYTLFKHTDKRLNPNQRGRFNIGEKQVISICKDAKIETTKGTILFNNKGRLNTLDHRDKGTLVTISVEITKPEYDEMLESLKVYLSSQNIKTTINGEPIEYKTPFKTIEATLQTEIESDGYLRKTQRKTEVNIHKVSGDKYLYEMQIPITKIDCEYSIDVQQKIPLNIDRETVGQAFLQSLYAEVLNNTFNDIPEENSSQVWIRDATGNERITGEAIQTITKKRFGDKVLVANPFDPNANDEAISRGYRLIQSRELSVEEREQLKEKAPIDSTTKLFGVDGFAQATKVEPTPEMLKVSKYAKKIHKKLNDVELAVVFIECPDSTEIATYGDGAFGRKTLTFNVSYLQSNFFDNHLETTDLILHELGHEFGNHTDHSYHSALTRMAQQLVILALNEPEFFEVK